MAYAIHWPSGEYTTFRLPFGSRDRRDLCRAAHLECWLHIARRRSYWEDRAGPIWGSRRVLSERWSLQTGPPFSAQNLAGDRLRRLGAQKRRSEGQGHDECDSRRNHC